MDKVQPITRRAALVGALVSSATLAVPVSALSTRFDGPSLADLIAEHARLYAELIPLLDAQDEAETLYRNTPSPLVPLTLTPTRWRVSGSLELRLLGREHIAKEIRKTHASLLALHCSRFREEMAPAATADMQAALKRSQAKCMRALKAAVREMEAQRETTGYADALQRARVASAAEIAASRAIFAYVPRTRGEAEAKVEWIKAQDSGAPDPDQLEALYGSIVQAVLV